jgi:hypothetical protein
MNFYDAINKLINKIDTKLNYPINVIMGFKNSQYIDYELYDSTRKIDEILTQHTIVNIYDLSIIWGNGLNGIYSESLNNIHEFNNEHKIKEVLNSFDYIGTTQDNKFNIYLHLKPEENTITIDEIDYVDGDIQLPDFNHFKYQNLYNYQDEDSFINAVYIEFITRNARYNNLISDILITEESPFENESEEEFDLRMMMLEQETEVKQNKVSLQAYGLTIDEIRQLDLGLIKNDNFNNKNISSTQLKTLSLSKYITLTPTLTKDELISEYDKYQDELKTIFLLREKINKSYINNANEVINKFPQSFKKRQKDLIKAFFIFDYIQANQRDINKANNKFKIKFCNKKRNILQEFRKLLTNKKTEKNEFEEYPKVLKGLDTEIYKLKIQTRKKLKENESIFKEKYINYPKMNPSKYKDSIFHELSAILDEKPGQCKKIYSHIDQFIKNSMPL